MAAPAWLAALEPLAPDVVAVWQAIDDEGPTIRGIAFRREIRRRAGPGSAASILAQHEAIADALGAVLAEMPEPLLRAPGGEGDWNVAQAFAHTTGSRRWLAWAAALAARGEWPADPPRVVPGVPGPADADVATLLTLLAKSRRSLATSAEAIAGHEAEPCPLDHPLVGRLRCGEWLLFAGVHDLMHLRQLHRLRASVDAAGDG
ncbi:MAG: DinB family protein [Chloroflexota bacterium]|nr:DinB family protein [Chloroflexota bacterium]